MKVVFYLNVISPHQLPLAREIVAMANSLGGMILLGIEEGNSQVGLADKISSGT